MSTPSSQSVPQPLSVFVSYSHWDEDFKDELVVHLANLKRQGKIHAWQDRDIEAGTEWDAEIKQQLETAEIILLLITPRFLASDYCYDLEMQRAIQRHNEGTARVIPIILKPVDWQGTPFSKLQVLPKDAKPITKWDDQDEAFLNVVQGIRRAVESLQAKKQTGATTVETTQVVVTPNLPLTSHNLTEKQLNILKWFVEEVRSGKLDEEEIWVSWTIDINDGTIIEGYQGEVPKIKETALEALERDNCIISDLKGNKQYRFSLVRRAYEIVDASFGNSPTSSVHLPSFPTTPSTTPSPMTSAKQQRLERQLADLQAEWSLKMDRLKKLKADLAIQAGTSVKFQLEQEVQAAEADIAQLEAKLDAIEQDINAAKK